MDSQIKAYFEDLATHHPDLQHTAENPCWFRSLKEAQQAIAGGKYKAPILVYNYHKLGLGNNTDALVRTERHYLLVLQPWKEKTFGTLDTVFDQTYTVANRLLSRVFHDRQQWKEEVSLFDLLNVSMDQVGPVLNDWYGYEITFPNAAPHQLDYDETQWGDYVP